jgi:hypothetical protein
MALKGHYYALVSAQQLNTVDEMENGNKEDYEGESCSKLCKMKFEGRNGFW